MLLLIIFEFLPLIYFELVLDHCNFFCRVYSVKNESLCMYSETFVEFTFVEKESLCRVPETFCRVYFC